MKTVNNKHFIQFLNHLHITLHELASKLHITYGTIRNRSEMLDFTIPELIYFSEFTAIPLGELTLIIAGKKSLKEAEIPYAITKEIALHKFTQDDDFVRMILECSFVGAHQKRRIPTQQEINTLKKHFQTYNNT